MIRTPEDVAAMNTSPYTHSEHTLEIMVEWFDWAYKRKNIVRPSMKLFPASRRNGPRVKIRVDYVQEGHGHMALTCDDRDAPVFIQGFAELMIAKCPDLPPFDPGI